MALGWLVLQDYRPFKIERRQLLEFAQRGVPIVTYPLMANAMLTKPGVRAAPGLVIGAFEEGIETSAVMQLVLMKVMEVLSKPPTTEDERYLHELMAGQKYQHNRRRRLPESLTWPPTIHVFDLHIDPKLLKGHHNSEPLLPCIAEPGDAGQIEVLPWWVVESAVPVR